MNKQTSQKQIAANRANAKKSTGPINTASTKYNAVKHGLLAQGITELDQPEEFPAFLHELKLELRPEGIIENDLVLHIAGDLVRGRRARALEARAITERLNPPEEVVTLTQAGHDSAFLNPVLESVEVVDFGLPAELSSDSIDRYVNTYIRYETAIANSLARNLKLLAERQALRRKNAAESKSAV